ncbi:AraC family transcriptional regulator [Nocardioides sp. BP30]|uniref:helix-turn-helix transcriptional regulator n=1 Tax=Nocardioides sp. BP30 TaxID=3036374 RepID=UPI002469690D|nr:AraC family transcriptional regulator [Nocardioides sp. BP30]WGL51376.1 AraC family transcriptional regulator [Nocardioides sp. BP30]
MGSAATIRAWRPEIAGVAEVLHAHFPRHAYPPHTHGTWTLLVVDSGTIGFELGRHDHGAMPSLVTLLPPHVPHDGHNATSAGFRKRVIYLEEEVLGAERIGAAVDRPGWRDGDLLAAVRGLDDALGRRHDRFEAEARLALVADALHERLDRRPRRAGPAASDRPLAARLRRLLDERLAGEVVLADLAAELGAHPTHLVRSFGRSYGIAPYRYLTGRRLDHARRLLLSGTAPSVVAAEVGFYDQAHLTRHFRRLLGTTPAAYARSAR